GVYPSFILGSYSYVQPVRNPVTRKINHLVGLYVQLQHGKHSYPTWDKTKKIYMGGLFAIRDDKGRYTINEVNGRHNGSDTPLTTVRAIEPSPFRNDMDVYFGGHDCANIMSTNFAWMYKAPLRTVLRLPPKISARDQAREWKDVSGRVIQAVLKDATQEKVILSKEGREYVLPLVRLSEGDREYVKKYVQERQSGAISPAKK
ncbi:MAG: hypothetical protein H8E24_01550, partial [Verrucomicrobia bacterium]|nr:hypothetical protein [Verrucomicrobiota bacterium]